MSEITVACDDALRRQLADAHLDQYFGVWAIEESAFRSAITAFQNLNLAVHLQTHKAAYGDAEDRRREKPYQVTRDGVGVLKISGPLMKHASSFTGGSSTVTARRALRQMLADDEVKAIMLVIDSPGGKVAGTKELADEVAATAKEKLTWAYCEDLCASAAYWIGSQSARMLANATALVGSIGTFAVVEDYSARAAQLGVKVHVVKAGAHKGVGVAGTEVTPEQLVDLQRLVDGMNEHFLAGVMAGRKLPAERVRELADGRIHIASEAFRLGLIDAVATFDLALAELSAAAAKSPKGKRMSQELPADNKPKAATAAELEAACAGADEKFLFAQLKAGATVDSALRAWVAEQNTRLAASRQETEQAKASAAKPGVDPLPSGGGAKPASGADPIDAFNDAVALKVQAGMKRHKAVAAVARENPELQEAFVAAHNAQHQPKRRAG